MKKTYFAPFTQVVELKDPICLDIASANSKADDSEVLGRGNRGSVWDDDED